MSNFKELFPRAELKYRAKSVLKGNWGPTLIATLIYLVCGGGLSYISDRFSGDPTWGYANMVIPVVIILIGGFLVHGVLEFSFCRYFVNMAHKESVVFGDFVEGFSDAGRAIVAYIWQTIFVCLWCLVLIPAGIVMTIGVINNNGLLNFVAGILFIAGFCFLVARVVRYSFQYMIMADAPEINGRDALSYSIDMTQGHVWDLIKLDISFFFWGVLAVITLGLGSFYVVPYVYQSNVQAYQWIRDEAFREGRLDPVKLGYKKNDSFVK